MYLTPYGFYHILGSGQARRIDMATKGRTLDEYIDKYRTAATAGEVAVFDVYVDHFSLASQILEARKKAGLTQTDLAARTGIGQSEISRIERGTGNPTEETLAKIGHAMNKRLAFVDIPPPT
jgi:DNA-binding XRE family transcriptional regulator